MATESAPAEQGFSKVACDQCHRCKLRCSRELPQCERCSKINSHCTFSTGKPIGKPRGSKNKHPRRSGNAAKRKQEHADRSTFSSTLPTPDHQPLQRQNGDWHAHKDISPQSSSTTSFPSAGGLCDTQNREIGRRSLGSFTNADTEPVSPSIGLHALPPIAPLENRYSTSSSNAFSPLHSGSSLVGVDAINTTDFQPESQALGLGIEATSPSCTCSGYTMPYLLSLLQEAHHLPDVSMLDRSLTLLRNGLQLCEQSLKCQTCRHNSGALLFLTFIHRAMSQYGKILSGLFTSQPSSPSSMDVDFGVVAIEGLEIDRSLQRRILEAVVKTEMRAGVHLLETCERILSDEEGSIGSKVGAAEVQLVSALKEEFEHY